ncbi:copper fist DNA binding domain-containing protein [Halteromyces radiatus]|uniref:copper fist DNA binding domain-containing protein n=1 Tax=Halteromyces radiatus TaxID=101107 RepID=UPI00221FD5C6|nr:copper fist DNA binding domain-containing protein [Halteromyces radiatus]KAI8096674.1 copper fist DNA binding domain-containing protein [Halteromyces radiatus]
MVYITDEDGTVRKFACLTCIKGHRSSGCQHADRELVEIRKKGRPVSQCAHCRNLRKTKQVHIKCLCHKKSEGTKNHRHHHYDFILYSLFF